MNYNINLEIMEGGFPFTQHSPEDAGYDIKIPEDIVINLARTEKISTKLKVEIPKGFFGLVVPRSSLGREGLILANTVGIIDSNYRGELILVFTNIGHQEVKLQKGQRVCQLILIPYIKPTVRLIDKVDESTSRGAGGFGSTGSF